MQATSRSSVTNKHFQLSLTMGEAVRRALHFGRQISCVFAKYPKCAHTKCLPADIHSFISARHFSNATFKCCLKSVSNFYL